MRVNVPSDAELVSRVAANDRRALEILYDRYAAAALGFALKLMGERSSAEEIVQEAFWRVWTRAATYTRGRGSFSAWFFGIVRNLAVDELRRRRARPQTGFAAPDATTLLDLADTDMDVADAALARVTGAQIRAALESLPETQRRVIELAYYEGLTHQEIARQLNEPLGTIHTRARLGLQKLRDALRALHLDEA